MNELPDLYKDGNQYVYPDNIVKKIKDLCVSKGMYTSDILRVMTIEGEECNIYRIEIFRVSNNYTYLYYTNKGLIVQRREI